MTAEEVEVAANAICERRNADDWPCNGLDFDYEMALAALEAAEKVRGKVVLSVECLECGADTIIRVEDYERATEEPVA
jgi:hypothetical protein